MSKIFVINDVGRDLTPSKKFGHVHTVLFHGSQNIFDHDRLAVDCKMKLREFNPDEDLLLLCGSGSICAYCTGLMLSWHGKVSVLVWDAKRKIYVQQKWTS